MKTRLLALILLGVVVPALAYADIYRVYVKRLGSNLYQDTQSRLIIETRYCYEYTYGDEAVLKLDGPYDSWIVFKQSGTRCDVVAVR